MGDIESKEAALFLFMTVILEIHEITSIEFGEADYDDTINSVPKIVNVPKINKEDLAFLELEETTTEKISNYFNVLFKEYITQKRLALETSQSKERQYVEAKKLTYISYQDSE